jgi:hypothetical protein
MQYNKLAVWGKKKKKKKIIKRSKLGWMTGMLLRNITGAIPVCCIDFSAQLREKKYTRQWIQVKRIAKKTMRVSKVPQDGISG